MGDTNFYVDDDDYEMSSPKLQNSVYNRNPLMRLREFYLKNLAMSPEIKLLKSLCHQQL